ncbi:MAG: hypothetical protein GC137_01150 [Alphaproteobacteria bacterium]|nr:hypothetical protein [Alphaproteobacteria bacterium]
MKYEFNHAAWGVHVTMLELVQGRVIQQLRELGIPEESYDPYIDILTHAIEEKDEATLVSYGLGKFGHNAYFDSKYTKDENDWGPSFDTDAYLNQFARLVATKVGERIDGSDQFDAKPNREVRGQPFSTGRRIIRSTNSFS